LSDDRSLSQQQQQQRHSVLCHIAGRHDVHTSLHLQVRIHHIAPSTHRPPPHHTRLVQQPCRQQQRTTQKATVSSQQQ
jgi:hypothetical protein